MKVIAVACSMLLALGTVVAAAAAPPEWVVIDTNRDSAFSYDSASVTRPEKGIVRVTARVVYTEKGKKEALEILDPVQNYARLAESHYIYDINCAKKVSKLREVSHVDEEGATLKTIDVEAFTKWEELPPGARLTAVSSLVCIH